MSIENEAIAAGAAEELEDKIIDETISPASHGLRMGDLLPDMSFILAPTGDGPIENYVDHVMNPHGSRGTARILRGATGMLGSLNYAIIDIALGTMELMKEGKPAHAEATDGEQ